jgi:hypothetical protein
MQERRTLKRQEWKRLVGIESDLGAFPLTQNYLSRLRPILKRDAPVKSLKAVFRHSGTCRNQVFSNNHKFSGLRFSPE